MFTLYSFAVCIRSELVTDDAVVVCRGAVSTADEVTTRQEDDGTLLVHTDLTHPLVLDPVVLSHQRLDL